MTQLEMVEKLREMVNISFEEAKNTLERNNWDMLDAVIELEKTGKTVRSTNSYTTQVEAPKNTNNRESSGFTKAWKWFIALLKKGITNKFVVSRDTSELIVIPVLLLIVILFAAPYLVVTLLVVGLLFRFRYYFRGEDLGKQELNSVFDKAADYAENLKSYVNENRQKGNSDGDEDTHN
jgi:hypothetical protein